MSFHRWNIHKAKKVHVCEWCGKYINNGDRYFYECGVTDNDFFSLKYHLDCHSKLHYTITVEEHTEDFESIEMVKDTFDRYHSENYINACRQD